MRKNITYICLLLFLVACQNDQIIFNDDNLQKAYQVYNSENNIESAKAFVGSVVQYTVESSNLRELEKALLTGISVSDEHKLPAAKSSFMTTFLKKYPNHPKNADMVYDLATTMETLQKQEAANALYYSFIEKYRKDPRIEKAKEKMDGGINDIDDYLKSLGEGIFENPDEFGINRQKAQAYVDACEAYAMVNPESVATPDFLYKASEIARTLKTFPKVLSIYDWILEKYPDFEKTPTCLFLKGFILENELNNLEDAKSTYQDFINKYPNHQLSDDVQFLIENIGKSDEEIMQIITQRQNAG